MTRSQAPRPDASTASNRCQVCAARQNCLVGQLPRARQERMDAWIREVEFHKGDTLQTEGEATGSVRTIKLGSVMLTRKGPDGVARAIAVVGRGHLLGQWRLFDQPTQVGALALSTGRACELPVAALGVPLQHEPAFRDALHTSMAHTFARLADWSLVMRLRGLPSQLVATLLLLSEEQATAAVRLPSHVALAAVLSTSRESVARTLRQLETAGYLQRIDRWHAALTPSHRAVFDDGPRKS